MTFEPLRLIPGEKQRRDWNGSRLCDVSLLVRLAAEQTERDERGAQQCERAWLGDGRGSVLPGCKPGDDGAIRCVGRRRCDEDVLRSELSLCIAGKHAIRVCPYSAGILQLDLDIVCGVRKAIKAVDSLVERPEAVLIPRPTVAIWARCKTCPGVAGGRWRRRWQCKNPRRGVDIDGHRAAIPHQVDISAVCERGEFDRGVGRVDQMYVNHCIRARKARNGCVSQIRVED